MNEIKKLLLVEDSSLVLKVLKRIIQNNNSFEAEFAETYAQAKNMIGENPTEYFAALVDLNLPDAPKGEVVDLVLENKIPTVVLTSSYSEKNKDLLIKKGVVDYVIKESRYSYESAIKIINRLNRNHHTKILVVDDSSVARKQCTRLLEKYLFQVIEANSAKEAVHQLTSHTDIKLVITDYNMPGTDGFELVKLIRTKYDKQNLTIIGLSGDGDNTLSSRFIKNGANDFLKKPFVQEEFYCRVMHNIENMESVERIKDNANKDFLTGLFNRQYFYHMAEQEIQRDKNEDRRFCVAVLEIDNFDEFNNVYHGYGDNITVEFARYFTELFSGYLIGRLSSSQYVIYFSNLDKNKVFNILEIYREKMTTISFENEKDKEERTLTITVSGSIAQSDDFVNQGLSSLTSMLVACDKLLARAKEAGQDIIIFD